MKLGASERVPHFYLILNECLALITILIDMFSIAKFIFGQKTSLIEGGNTRALVRDPLTGNVVGPAQVKKRKGREAYADKIDLKAGRINRQELRNDVIKMLKVIDAEFNRDYGVPLWDASQRDELLTSGFAFNGSSAHLFAPPEVLSDEEFIEFKPVVGDIDLTTPSDKTVDLYKMLTRLEDKQLTDKITYIGHNKQSTKELDQINALFAYTWDPNASEGEGETFFQIDFESSGYSEGRPTPWFKFAYSSSWDDIKLGVKGVAHKMLIFSIVSATYPSPKNAREATPAATAAQPRIKMKASKKYVPPSAEEVELKVQQKFDELMAAKKQNPDVARKKAEDQVRKELAAASMTPARLGALKGIDLLTGQSSRYKKLDWQFDGEEVYAKLKRAEREDITTDLNEIFIGLFGKEPPPTEKDLKNFGSFVGVLEILKDRKSPQDIVKIYEGLIFRFFGYSSQQLSATDPAEDLKVKDTALNVFRRILPEAEASTVDIEALKKTFYEKYKVRGQAGFEEDDSSIGINESLFYSNKRLFEIIRGQ